MTNPSYPQQLAPAPALSPCIKVCKLIDMDTARVCSGCGRTLEDIAQWSKMTRVQQLASNAQAKTRLELLHKPKPATS